MKLNFESGIIKPPGRMQLDGALATLRETFIAMKSGDSFVYDDNKKPYLAAKQVGIKIATRKLGIEGYRVWRIS